MAATVVRMPPAWYGAPAMRATNSSPRSPANTRCVWLCSAVSTSCNGVALLKAMDYALDPDGDGDFSDSVDVINLSLGTDYGQGIEDLTLAAVEAVEQGVIVVSSAGNGADRPYKASSPGIGLGVISVA